MTSLWESIGAEVVSGALEDFYRRAFEDGIIGHFFFGKDRDHITRQQIAFASGLLGGPLQYRGRPLGPLHQEFDIRPPHFRRRQVLLREVLSDWQVPDSYADAWLEREGLLEGLVVRKGG